MVIDIILKLRKSENEIEFSSLAFHMPKSKAGAEEHTFATLEAAAEIWCLLTFNFLFFRCFSE